MLCLNFNKEFIVLFYIKFAQYISYIFEAVDGVGYVLKAKDMNDRHLQNYTSGDVVPDEIADELFKDSTTYLASCISELESKRGCVEVYKTVNYYNTYQVVTDGVIRHPDVNADATIRAITHYAS